MPKAGADGPMSIESQSLSADVLSSPGVDRVLEALSNRERRHLLIELRDGRVDHEFDVETRGEDRWGLQLRHTHLPKLTEWGFIEWNQDTGEIAAGPRFDEIEPLLDLIERHADELPADWP